MTGPRRLFANLYAQVLIGIALGALLGLMSPESAVAMREPESISRTV